MNSEIIHQIQKDQQISNQVTSGLEFTGNWFIDAGILGFVNLMEEVYGWDLETLQNKINENDDLVYYGYFPFAYLFYYSKIRKSDGEIRLIKNNINKEREKFTKKKKELFNIQKEKTIRENNIKKSKIKKVEDKIKKIEGELTEIKKIILQNKDDLNKKEDNFKKDKQNFLQIVSREIVDILDAPQSHFVSIRKKIESIIPEFELRLPQRNFFLTNPKKGAWFSFAYVFSVLKNDINRIKTLRVAKDEKTLNRWLRFCSDHSHNTEMLVSSIEEDILKGKNRKEIMSILLKNCNAQDCKDHEEVCAEVYKNIKKECGELVIYEEFPDATINPFFYSPGEFSNIGYTNPHSIAELKKIFLPKLPLYAAFFSFPHTFQFIGGRNLSFYSNSLYYTYSIHKNVKIKVESTRSKSVRDFFKITIKSIIDELIEKQSLHSLEYLYVIEHLGVSNQRLLGVQYLKISKLNAILLLDDTIRENINKSLCCNESRKDKKRNTSDYVWIIEELLNEKPLIPYVIEHIERFVKKGNIFFSLSTSLYILMVDANKQKLGTNGKHFQQDFFKGYPNIIDGIKRDINYTSYAANALAQILKDSENLKVYGLLDAINGNNSSYYLNILYRIILESEDKINSNIVSMYIFKNIIQNVEGWAPYGLALLLQVVRQWKMNLKKT